MSYKKPKKQVNQISLIFGKKGSGKTTFARKLIGQSTRKNLIIWDFLGEYENGLICKSITDVVNTMRLTKKARLIVRIEDSTEFETLCRIVFALQNCLLVVEEADSVCSSSFIDNQFASLIRYGRHRDVDIIAITRRPPDINRLLTSQADVLYCYRFQEPRDIEYLTKLTGSPDHCFTDLTQYNYYEYMFD